MERPPFPVEDETFPFVPKSATGVAMSPLLTAYSRLEVGQVTAGGPGLREANSPRQVSWAGSESKKATSYWLLAIPYSLPSRPRFSSP